jgi:hypothetical protein
MVSSFYLCENGCQVRLESEPGVKSACECVCHCVADFDAGHAFVGEPSSRAFHELFTDALVSPAFGNDEALEQAVLLDPQARRIIFDRSHGEADDLAPGLGDPGSTAVGADVLFCQVFGKSPVAGPAAGSERVHRLVKVQKLLPQFHNGRNVSLPYFSNCHSPAHICPFSSK